MAAAGGDQQFEALLTACLSTDNETRKRADDALRALAGQPQAVPQLTAALAGAADPQARQLACVLARRFFARQWPALPLEVRAGVQDTLLQRLACEPSHACRRALAGVVAAVAQLVLPPDGSDGGESGGSGNGGGSGWPALLVFLGECARPGSGAGPELVEVGLLLFAALLEACGEQLAPHAGGVLAAVAAGVASPHPAVRDAALGVVEPLLPHVGGSGALVPQFHQLVAGSLLPCLQRAAAARDDEVLQRLCQALVEVAESPAPLLQPCLGPVLQGCMSVAADRALQPPTRELAMALLMVTAHRKPRALARLGKPFVHACVDALCAIMAEPSDGDNDGDGSDDDDDELPPSRAAAQALDALAVALNSSAYVLPPAWAFVQAAARDAGDARRRAAAMLAVGVLAEGAAEPMRRRLGAVLPTVLLGLRDAAPSVRGDAAFAVGQLAEYLQPEASQHCGEVLPALLPLLGDRLNPTVQERACYALDAFTAELEPEQLQPAVPQLVDALLGVLADAAAAGGGGGGGAAHHGGGGPKPAVQEMALSALASVAMAAQKGFAPFAPRVLPALQHYMSPAASAASTAAAEGLLLCRCKAVEAAGILIEALGADDATVGPLIPALLEGALQGFSDASAPPDLRDHAHGALARTAKALGAAFAPWMPRVVPLSLASCQLDDGAAGGGWGDGDDDSNTDDDSDDSDSEGGGGRRRGGARLNVRTGLLDEKAAAAAALGAYAEAAPAAFVPSWAEQACAALLDAAGAWHEDLRAAAHESLAQLALATHAAFPPAAAPSPTQQQQQQQQHQQQQQQQQQVLSSQTALLLDAVLPVLGAAAEDDVSKRAVAAAAAALARVLKGLPAGAVPSSHLEAAANVAKAVLDGSALCLQVEEDDGGGGGGEEDEEDDEEAGEEDEELLASAADLLPALAASMPGGAAAYAPAFLSLHAPHLLERLKPRQPAPLRAVAAGALAEAVDALGVHAAPVAATALPLLLRELRGTEDDMNRQNAAFAVGLLFGAAPEQLLPQLPQALAALHPLFRADEAPGARDNAAGAVGRILLALPPGSLPPLGQVLPVLLGALPLAGDPGEAKPVVEALCRRVLLDERALQADDVRAHVPRIVQAFGQIMVQEAAPVEAKRAAARALAALHGRFAEQLGPLLAALPAEQQAALQAHAAAAAAGDDG